MELIKGPCSEVKAMLEEPTSCVEAPRGSIEATPGPEGAKKEQILGSFSTYRYTPKKL